MATEYMEEKWLRSIDPLWMIDKVILPNTGLVGQERARKLRLMMCGWCRQIWSLLRDQRSRNAVEVGEKFADGKCRETELSDARSNMPGLKDATWYRDGQVAINCVFDEGWHQWKTLSPTLSYEGLGEFFRPAMLSNEAQANIIRDIFGNPFRPTTIGRQFITGQAIAMAEHAYDNRDWASLPVISDALEEAGCIEQPILDHLRGPGPHVRGCWCLDVILGKS